MGYVKIEVSHHFVIQSEAKDFGNILYVIEIFRTESSTTRLPPYGRLNDNMIGVFHFDTAPLHDDK